MDVVLRRTDNHFFSFFCFCLLSLLLLFSCLINLLIRKSFARLGYLFDIKAARNIDKANSKIFFFDFASFFFHCNW